MDKISGFRDIEKEFFEIDETAKVANVCLHFECLENVLNDNIMSKAPIFTDDFRELLKSVFGMIPSKYKISLDLTFDHMNGYTSEQLHEVFQKNILLTIKSLTQSTRDRNNVAVILFAFGMISFVSMVLIGNLWMSESFLHEILIYIFDISTTVLLWEAAGILLVESRENRIALKGYRERFDGIRFHVEETGEIK